MQSANTATAGRGSFSPALTLGALGVVFGDIGTSPLYAFQQCFDPVVGIPLSTPSVLGILSLIFWSLTCIVFIKYVAFIMRADNNGEGGIMALLALALRTAKGDTHRQKLLLTFGIFGAALFYGDGVITPAISVLSAIEGLKIVTPGLDAYVIPITIGVLFSLFLIQRRGTASVGTLFGPVMLVWFAVLAIMGLANIGRHTEVLYAANPLYALHFVTAFKWKAFVTLGAVVLTVTGAEALYADMGHFGRKPITLAWIWLVFPALLLNYAGQGALVLSDPRTISNPFYLMAPHWGLIPLVLLSTMATVIASQAVISGVFSMTRQAMQLGYAPRMEIQHTSSREIGQIYIPGINWALLLAIIALVFSFKSSANLAAAYGIAVTGTMVSTTLLAIPVFRNLWGWSRPLTALAVTLFFIVDITFFSANLLKLFQGGWFPLTIGLMVFTLMATWKRGRQILFARLSSETMPLNLFINSIGGGSVQTVPGTAVFMTGSHKYVPHALLHNLKHNKILHERNVLLTLVTRDIPFVDDKDRVQVEKISHNFYLITGSYGFKEQPDVPALLDTCKCFGMSFDMMDTSFFLSRERLIATVAPGMAMWREKLFVAMSRNAAAATDFFQIPANRVVELGTQIEL
jgi:KUP system potassium uptake protein